MKTLGYFVLTLAALVLITYSSLYAWQIVDRQGTMYPSPANETAFLQTYDPQAAIEPFKADEGYSTGRDVGDGAGEQFVSHLRQYDYRIVIRASEWQDLMNNVYADVTIGLRQHGAQIVESSGNAASVFRLEYTDGQSLGHVTIQPVGAMVRRNTPLPAGMKDVGIRIKVEEKWFPAVEARGQMVAIHPAMQDRTPR
jgi:hypothetical protein